MVWAESGAWGHDMGFHGSISPEMASALHLTNDQMQIIQELRDASSNEMAPLQNQLFSKKAKLAETATGRHRSGGKNRRKIFGA
jgi:hypothetical protein